MRCAVRYVAKYPGPSCGAYRQIATGFMGLIRTLSAISVTLLLLLTQLSADAADITVSALFNGKAVLIIDGGKPRTLSAGQVTPEGVRLVSASSEAAVIEYEGQRQTLSPGHGTRIGITPGNSGTGQVTLNADIRGHFVTTGAVNGVAVRFLVDTGASTVAFSTAEAKRLGINYLAGTRGLSSTANGTVHVYRVKPLTAFSIAAVRAEGCVFTT